MENSTHQQRCWGLLVNYWNRDGKQYETTPRALPTCLAQETCPMQNKSGVNKWDCIEICCLRRDKAKTTYLKVCFLDLNLIHLCYNMYIYIYVYYIHICIYMYIHPLFLLDPFGSFWILLDPFEMFLNVSQLLCGPAAHAYPPSICSRAEYRHRTCTAQRGSLGSPDFEAGPSEASPLLAGESGSSIHLGFLKWRYLLTWMVYNGKSICELDDKWHAPMT